MEPVEITIVSERTRHILPVRKDQPKQNKNIKELHSYIIQLFA